MGTAPAGWDGRLAHLPTQESLTQVVGQIAAAVPVWIGMKSTVPDSPDWSDWYWYDDANTATSSVSYVPAGSDIATASEDCGYLDLGNSKFYDASDTTNLNILCEFMCRKYTSATCRRVIVTLSLV